jgi:hypothetical protein
MTSRTLLLTLHIVAVAGWLGANFVQLVLAPRFARVSNEIASAWARQTIWLGERYYPIVGAVIAITGVLLVLDTDRSWSAGFIWVGVTVVVIGGVLGGAFFGPLAKKRVAALDEGDVSRADGVQRRIIPLALLDTALVITAILAMVHKWQA